MKKYFSNPKIITGIVLTGLAFLLMLLGMVYLPYDPDAADIPHKLQRMSMQHLLGTDNLGRDILSRIMTGYRISFLIGLTSAAAGLAVGCIIGAAGGYLGGAVDVAVVKLIDIQMAFPGILLALMLIAVAGPGLHTTITALCIMSVPRFARITRSGCIKYRDSFLVLSARSRGASSLRIIMRHILPNIAQDLCVTFSLSFAYAVMNESGLSYLGLGVQPPEPSFGRMLSDAQNYILTSPWFIIVPAVALAVPVSGLMLIGDGMTGLKDKD